MIWEVRRREGDRQILKLTDKDKFTRAEYYLIHIFAYHFTATMLEF